MNIISPFKNVEQYTRIIIEPHQMNSDIRNHMKFNLKKKVEELSNKYNENDYYEKYSSEERDNFDIEKSIFRDVLNVQRIIRNKEYFQEIKDIERELTNIELTDKEKELINKFVNHPKLEGAIAFHGINLIDGFY